MPKNNSTKKPVRRTSIIWAVLACLLILDLAFKAIRLF